MPVTAQSPLDPRDLQQLIGAIGGTATLRRIAIGAYDVVSGVTDLASTEEDMPVVLLRYGNRSVDGSTILRGDRRAIMAGDPPAVGDQLVTEGATYRVLSVETLDPKPGSPLVSIAQVRA